MQLRDTVITIGILAALGAWAYHSWVVQPEKNNKRLAAERIVDSKRFQNWAYVAKEKEIAPGEIVKLLIIPSSLGVDILDVKCLIYTHQEFKTSSMICPDADQNAIEEAE